MSNWVLNEANSDDASNDGSIEDVRADVLGDLPASILSLSAVLRMSEHEAKAFVAKYYLNEMGDETFAPVFDLAADAILELSTNGIEANAVSDKFKIAGLMATLDEIEARFDVLIVVEDEEVVSS